MTVRKRAGAMLLIGTMLGSLPASALAQAAPDPLAPAQAPPPEPAPAPAPAPAVAPTATIRSIAVAGNQRLEAETIRSYANLAPGQAYSAQTLDQALKDLY